MRTVFIAAILLAASAVTSWAQDQEATELWEKPYSLSIQDNSFFIEEAFNQESRVVQHISTLTYFRKPLREVGYSFTQEWPLGSSRHQLSYEIPYTSLELSSGVGDLVLNYRYQLLDKPDGIAFAPRFSLVFPTGNEGRGLGMGAMGFEVNLPASKRLSEVIAVHANAGITLYPFAEVSVAYDPSYPDYYSVRRAIPEYFVGGSVIYLAHPNVNIMLEWVSFFTGDPDLLGEIIFSSSRILSPGIRAALNFDDLQIVPGFAVPVRFHDGVSETGLFGYLSFEHPF